MKRFLASVVAVTVLFSGSALSVEAAAPTGLSIAKFITTHVSDAVHAEKLTKKTDGNHLLGKPNGYLSATVIYDDRGSCEGGLGVACGAVVETFATAAKAARRQHYLIDIFENLKGSGLEGEGEYDYRIGKVVLRVNGVVGDDSAHQYKAAFAKAVK